MDMRTTNGLESVGERLAATTPPPLARRLRGLSDRTIALLFITPSIALLLAINIFPLIWTIRLSFTNFKSNMPSIPVRFTGSANYTNILTAEEIWHAMQAQHR